METPTRQDVAAALAKVARRRLVRGEPVPLPGVGTIEVRHARSAVEERAPGETILQPPKDLVIFTPDEESG